MTKNYFKTIFSIIIINVGLIMTIGIISKWNSSFIISGIINISILTILIYIPYIFLQQKGIKSNEYKILIFIYFPSIIMIIFLVNNLIQLKSGNYIELGNGINIEGKFKPRHIKIIQTGIVIIVSLLTHKRIKIRKKNE